MIDCIAISRIMIKKLSIMGHLNSKAKMIECNQAMRSLIDYQLPSNRIDLSKSYGMQDKAVFGTETSSTSWARKCQILRECSYVQSSLLRGQQDHLEKHVADKHAQVG